MFAVPRVFAVGGGIVLVGVLILAGPGGAGEPVRDREVPDLDRRLPAVLDLETSELGLAPRPSSFAKQEEYEAALTQIGDVAYDDAQGGLLFVAAGFALPLGTEKPNAGDLRDLAERLEQRLFLRGSELAAGSWFAVRTRAGKVSLGLVVSRSPQSIRLRWSQPHAASQHLVQDRVDALVTIEGVRQDSALLPPLGETPESVLRLHDGEFVAGPDVTEPFRSEQLAGLVAGVRSRGDLAYFRLRSGMLIVGGGKLARLGAGPVAMLAGRDLRPRLRGTSTVSSHELTSGSVLLIETTRGNHALVRIDAVETGGLRLTWLLQPDGSAIFKDLAVFDASFKISDPDELNRLLLAAAARGDAASIRRMIGLGADVNTRIGRDARPALVHSVIDGDLESATVLLEAGADTAGAGADGWNALHVAVRLGRKALVQALLDAGADPKVRTPEGQNALQLALGSPRENLELIRLLRRESNLPGTLALAARIGDIASLKSLLEEGSEVDLPDAEGRTPLQIAAASGQSAAVRILLEGGADPGLSRESGGSALLDAVRAGQVAAAKILVEHGGIPSSQKSGALYRANERGSAELARLLLAAGADASLDQGQGLSPLEHALQYANGPVVAVYVENGYEVSPAAAARLGLGERLAELLEEEGAASEASADGRLPIQHAIENNRVEALRVLLDHGTSADAPLPTWDRRSPLHDAAARADVEVVTLLLKRGADANRLDRVGRSPLYEAVAHGRVASTRVLLESGADPKLAPEGEALLDVARVEAIRVLLEEYGAPPASKPRR